MKKYYLAYGSNLNLTHMNELCPNAIVVGKTVIKDYRLAFKGRRTGFLTIEPAEQSIVPVGVFEITDTEERRLDSYESYPTFYTKETFTVTLGNQEISAIIYIMNPIFSYSIPSMEYLTMCNEGYRDFAFDRTILSQALETTMDNLDKRLIK